MTGHDAERAYVAAMLDVADDRLDETIAAMQTDIDRLRDEWAAGYAEQRQAHEDRLAAMRDETRQYLQSIAAGDDDGNERTDVTAGGRGDASALAGIPVGHNGPQQWPTPDPREADRAERERLAAMSMTEYRAERERRGIGNSASTRGLFSQ